MNNIQKQNTKRNIDEAYQHFIDRPKFKATKNIGIKFTSGKRFTYIETEAMQYKSYLDMAIAGVSLSTLETPRKKQIENIDFLIKEFSNNIEVLKKLNCIKQLVNE